MIDSLGLSPGVRVTPSLTSPDMIKKRTLTPIVLSDKAFVFSKLPPGEYVLHTSYEGYIDEQHHILPDDGENILFTFSPRFSFNLELFDIRGGTLGERTILLERESKKIESTADTVGETSIAVPPGVYKLSIFNQDSVIRETMIEITRYTELYMVTEEEPPYPLLVLGGALLAICVCLVLFILKKVAFVSLLKLIAIGLILIALMQPWWGLYGDSDDGTVTRFTTAYVIPQAIITKTTFEDYVEAEPANLPQEFSNILLVIGIIICLSAILVFLSILVKSYRKTSMSIVLLGITLLLVALLIFSFGFSELAKIGLGSLQDSGNLNILTPGTADHIAISAAWGLTSGFYLCLTAIIIWGLSLVVKIIYPNKIKIKS